MMTSPLSSPIPYRIHLLTTRTDPQGQGREGP
jgi:hypothetical protein